MDNQSNPYRRRVCLISLIVVLALGVFVSGCSDTGSQASATPTLASQADAAADNGYTAGRILLDVSDSSGQANSDPNATGLKYSLTLDTGDVATGQEYAVNY